MISLHAVVVAVNDSEVLNACTFLLLMAFDMPDLESSATVAAIRADFPEAAAAAAAALSPLSVPPVPLVEDANGAPLNFPAGEELET